jgi:hypothetical protein
LRQFLVEWAPFRTAQTGIPEIQLDAGPAAMVILTAWRCPAFFAL